MELVILRFKSNGMVISGSSSPKIKPLPPDWVVESVGDAKGLSCKIGPSSGEQATLKKHKKTDAITPMHNDNHLFIHTKAERVNSVLSKLPPPD